jgi:alanyl-tRNA synthetase
MTEKCYYLDINKIEFEAESSDVVKEKKGWRVTLDKTYFFPEGGGQPADRGWINDIPVKDVLKKGDDIYHYLGENPGNGTVKGKIDPLWRRDFMQQHTGQHIISGALWKVGQYKTVSVHMGLDYTTIEIDAPEIPEEDLLQVEKLANRVINNDMPIHIVEISHREIDQFPLRKPTDLKGKIRLVRIGDFDCVACGGLHFDSTGKVELVKATGVEKIRGHVRMTWKIGERAHADYTKKNHIISGLRSVLSTNEEMFVRKTQELQEEILTYKRKCNMLENRLADTIARNLYEAHTKQGESTCRVIGASWREEEPNLIKKIMKELLKRDNTLICLVNIFPGKLQWSIGCSADSHFPYDESKNELLAIIDGKGGGRHPLWQGTGSQPGSAEDFIAAFRAFTLRLPLI